MRPWDELFEGYAAAVDWPTAAFWPRLMQVYPDARIVLTVRDADNWFASAWRTIFRSMHDGMQSDDADIRERLVMAREIIVDGTFGGDLEDRRNAIAVYEANVARVYREVPPERLVVFDGKDGWGPLCEALGVEEPVEPYPHINTSEEFLERWRGGANSGHDGSACGLTERRPRQRTPRQRQAGQGKAPCRTPGFRVRPVWCRHGHSCPTKARSGHGNAVPGRCRGQTETLSGIQINQIYMGLL